ncbi:MAG: Ig-like domain-containing protein [Sulfuricellaceae bacterium]|nr:Ig-like domain-containing protein [Sulfuricellaceae bacterium]
MTNSPDTSFTSASLFLLLPLSFPVLAEPATTPMTGQLAYVGSDTRLGLGYDTKTKLRGEVAHVFNDGNLAAWIGEGWVSGSSGGLKLNYNWAANDEKEPGKSVRKLFAAVDQNEQHDRKITLGGGLEHESLFAGLYVSAAISGRRQIGEQSFMNTETISGSEPDGRQYYQDISTTTQTRLFERPYDYGIGARVGRYFGEPLIRLAGGLDYEWGENSSHQSTVSVMLEKFIANTPHSIALHAEAYQKAGSLEPQRNDERLYFMYRYELGGKSYRPERPYRMVEAAPAARSPAPPVEAVKSAPSVEKRMVKTTATMLSDAFFELDSDKLTPAAKTALDSVINTLKNAGHGGNIHLAGHTCDLGSAKHNLKLSELRALSVRNYLTGKGGLTSDAFVVEGKGETAPRYPNTKDMRYRNRRVDLEFVTFAEKLEDVALPTETQPVLPAKAQPVEWAKEYIESEPAWMRRALRHTTPHKLSVDVYRQEERNVSTVSGEKRYVNRDPVARNDAYSLNRDQSELLEVMANDGDPDQDPLQIVSVSQPAHGSALLSGGKIRYTPVPGYVGADAFSYTIADGKGATSTAQVSLSVQAVNQLPVARNDQYTVPATSDSLLDVLGNDSDPDGDVLTVASFTQPSTGKVTQGPGGKLVFTPSERFASTVFSYTITDGKNGTATATVTLIDP